MMPEMKLPINALPIAVNCCQKIQDRATGFGRVKNVKFFRLWNDKDIIIQKY